MLNPSQFRYTLTTPSALPKKLQKAAEGEHAVVAHAEGDPKPVGLMVWGNRNGPTEVNPDEPDTPTRGAVNWIETRPDHRGRGVATGMWDTAHTLAKADTSIIPPEHSNNRTEAGDRWAKKVGGKTPEQWGSFIPEDDSRL